MRDPMAWALPVFRAFGIQVRVHLFFFLVTLGLCGRSLYEGGYVGAFDVIVFTIFVLFGIVLLHEFGHCFGGRYVGGEAEEILIWPLGGLAFVDVPRNWKAHTFMIAAGPFANLLICFVAAVAIAGAGFVPTLNPLAEPYACEMHNYRDGRTYTSVYGLKLYEPAKEGQPVPTAVLASGRGKPEVLNEIAVKSNLDRALAPGWIVWLNRTFWLSWVLFLFNLIPAFPLDGGQLLMGFIWAKRDYRTGVTVACYSGYVCGALFLLAGIATNETLLAMLSLFMLITAYTKLKQLEQDESPFGDFSNGYTSLDDAEDAPPPRPQQGFVKRWMIARAAKRLQRDLEERQRDDERMDQLLEKIARGGKAALTDEERRFMERVRRPVSEVINGSDPTPPAPSPKRRGGVRFRPSPRWGEGWSRCIGNRVRGFVWQATPLTPPRSGATLSPTGRGWNNKPSPLRGGWSRCIGTGWGVEPAA